MPAPKNQLKDALLRGEPRFGLWLAMAHPTAAEIAANAGFDWCLIDAEHGPNDIPGILSQLHALAGGTCEVCVRVPSGDPHFIKQVLDLGVQTLLVPMVETAEQARNLVRAIRYPTAGIRGVGAAQSRATQYGKIFDYYATADEEICLIVQIESRVALNNIEEIAAVDGVNGLFLGPADLAASLGYLGTPSASVVTEALEDAAARIVASGKALGVIAFDPTTHKRLREIGAVFLAVGGDVALFGAVLRSCADVAAANFRMCG